VTNVNRRLALLVLAFSQLMVVLDATIVNTAIPTIQHALGFSRPDLQWVVNAYTLAFGGFLLLGGRLADRFGRRLVFTSGAGIFAVASLLGGLAQSQGEIIASRAAQGLGAAAMSPAALSLLTVVFAEGKERDRAFGVWAGVSAGGAAMGLLLGGLLTEYASWRWVFFVNTPIAVLAVLGALAFVPEHKDDSSRGFDVVGAVVATLGLVSLVYGLVRGNELGWGSTQTVCTLLAAAVLIALFVVLQRRLTDPLIPGRVFHTSSAAGADVSALIIGAGLFGIFFFMSQFLQVLKGYGPMRAGLSFLPMSICIGISAGIASQVLSRTGPRRLLVFGSGLAALGLLSMARISPDSTYVGTVLPSFVCVALGMGCAFVSLASAAVAGVPRSDSGIASALLNSGQQVGGAIGLAVLTAVSTGRTNHLLPGGRDGGGPGKLSDAPHAVQAAVTSGWSWGFVVAAAIMASGSLVAALTVRISREEAARALAESKAVAV
jgi:EmrB/QacA subfamily drug resistance transporter